MTNYASWPSALAKLHLCKYLTYCITIGQDYTSEEDKINVYLILSLTISLWEIMTQVRLGTRRALNIKSKIDL
jgi:hypothetical protein